MSDENLKVGTKRLSSSTSFPVRGLRAGRALRSLQEKVPNPRISIVLFCCKDSPTILKNSSTAF